MNSNFFKDKSINNEKRSIIIGIDSMQMNDGEVWDSLGSIESIDEPIESISSFQIQQCFLNDDVNEIMLLSVIEAENSLFLNFD